MSVSPRQSWPITSGAKLRDYYLARALSRMGDLTYVFYQSSGAAPGETGFSFSSRVMPVPAPRLYRPAKVLKGLLGRWPLPVLNYTSPALIDTLANLLRTETFDVIHVDSVHLSAVMEPLKQACGKARIFYNWHNIESELMSRYAERALSFLHRAYALRTAQALRQAERHILENRARSYCLAVLRERGQLLAIAPQARIATIENGVDTALVSSGGGPPVGRSTIVFVGAMSYHANVDGAVYFARDVWPALRARYPRFDLALVGADPSPSVRALGSLPGITVTGTVEKILPYYQQAFAAVVPLRIGGGTRLKILEAMAAGVPVLSTTQSEPEGLEVTPGKEYPSVRNTGGLASRRRADQRFSCLAGKLAGARAPVGRRPVRLDEARRASLVETYRDLDCGVFKAVKAFLKTILSGVFLALCLPLALLSGFGRLEGNVFVVGPGVRLDSRPAWRLFSHRPYYRLTPQKLRAGEAGFSSGRFFAHPQVSLGSGVYIGSYCVFGRTSIGNRTQIASGVQILSGARQHKRDDAGKISSARRWASFLRSTSVPTAGSVPAPSSWPTSARAPL